MEIHVNKKLISTVLISEILGTQIWAKGLTNISQKEIDSLLDLGFKTELIENLEDETSPEIAFFNRVNISLFNSQSKLTLMHKKGNISKLGKEIIKGNNSGTLKYHARVKGLGGDVKMIYKNYSDFEGIIINGETNVTAKMNMQGHMYGTIVISDHDGNILGQIEYDNLEIIKGVDGGGGYTVTLPDSNPSWVEWNAVLRPEREEEEIGMDERK